MPSRNDAFGYRRDRSEMMNGRSEKLYGEFAAEFFGQVKSAKKPFFLMVNAHDPHRPFDNRKPAKERNFEPKAKQEAPASNGKKKRRPREIILHLHGSTNPMRSWYLAFFRTYHQSAKRLPNTTAPYVGQTMWWGAC